MRYKRRVTYVEAMQFRTTAVDLELFKVWGARIQAMPITRMDGGRSKYQVWVEKSKAWCMIDEGDYIVMESDKSGFYPCHQNTFIDLYQPAPLGEE